MKKYHNEVQNLVLQFQKTFSQPYEEKPKLPNIERFVNRKGWGVIEEVIEQIFVLCNSYEEFVHNMNILEFYFKKSVKDQLKKEIVAKEDKLKHLADGLGDEYIFLLGDCIECGINIDPIAKIIHESNMSKLFTNEIGLKYVKEDTQGKVIKSPEFFAPELYIEMELKKQSL